jgi:hypothetical protein
MKHVSYLILAAALCVAVPATGVLAAPNGQPIEIPAILSLSGPASFLASLN